MNIQQSLLYLAGLNGPGKIKLAGHVTMLENMTQPAAQDRPSFFLSLSLKRYTKNPYTFFSAPLAAYMN